MKPTRYASDLREVLLEAAQAFRGRDRAAFGTLLATAIDRAPQRLDLRFNLAGHYIQTDDVPAALRVFWELAELAPRDADALLHLSYWLDYADELDASADVFRRLLVCRPEAAQELDRLLGIIKTWLGHNVVDTLPRDRSDAAEMAVVILGYVLAPDGGMQAELLERLSKTLQAARAFPKSLVLATGGVPRAGRVEATEMRRWLEAQGVAAERIYEEGYARDLVENLLYSRQILDILGVKRVLIVTSAHNVRRTGAAMETIKRHRGSFWRVEVVSSSGDSFAGFVDNGSDRLKVYRDTLRASGQPMMRTFPELVEL